MKKKTLLATVAAAAVLGLSTLAVAQAPEGEGGKGGARPEGAQQAPKAAPGGPMINKQGGPQQSQKTLGQPGGQSAQGAGEGNREGVKPEERKSDERMGQSQQGQPADQNQGTPQRGAQDERGAQQPGKSGVNASEQGTGRGQSAGQGSGQGSRGGSVQLSQDQRTRIQGVIGKSHAARVSANVHFDVTIGARVPRSVHFEVLPADIVEIVPQYEGYDYVLVGDEILIIDPDSLEIVAVIPA